MDAPFCVGNHDFSNATIVPSVTLLCNVPEKINASFYSGKVQVALRVVYLNVLVHSVTVLNYSTPWSTVILTLTQF